MDRISGKTTFDVFKNYYTAEKRENCRLKVNNLSLQSKDDVVSERLRQLAKTDFVARKYYDCLEKYTESLRYATCNGREYALALANRSATYFAMDNYKNCLIDISLCLQADYPINLKPKILIRKAKCYIKMGNFKKMIETIDDCCNQMEANLKLPKIDKDNYMKEMKSVMDIKQVDIRKFSLDDVALAPEVILEENKVNPNISASIKLIYNKNTGTDYVAARDIPRGEVLFVDPAYSVGIIDFKDDPVGIFFCSYCWQEAKNCIPCKICVNYSYCSEDCLSSAWMEYHQYDCDMFRSILPAGELCLPVRTLIKGAFNGAIFKITNNSKPWKSSKDINPYLHIYSLHLDLASFRSKCTSMKFAQYCERAATVVEFLKRSNFFTRLMSTQSCQKNLDTLVNFVGGLLIRHIIQSYQRSLIMHSESSVVSVNETQTKFKFFLASRNLKFHAFCPLVSGVKYSCESNTSMYFNGSTCVVKACQDIKAGNCILRPGFNFTPGLPAFERLSLLQVIDINCDCTACKNINNNIDILNTFLCIECGRFSLLQILHLPFMVCNNCKQITSVRAVESMIGFERFVAILRNSVVFNQYFENLRMGLDRFKKLMNPNHEHLYVCYLELLLVYSERENLEEFKKALLDFKTCAKNRNGRFDTYQYLIDLAIISRACFNYLDRNKSILRKQEIKDMLTYSSDVINEAKEIAEFTFPPFLRLYAILEFFIFKFRVACVSLQD